jgi:hypothetical protein
MVWLELFWPGPAPVHDELGRSEMSVRGKNVGAFRCVVYICRPSELTLPFGGH